jgi:DHA1 family bicyclomycin/chloramphenicol resistance-like MFS transporter
LPSAAPAKTVDAHVPAKVSAGFVVLLGALTAFAPLSIDMYLPSLPTIARVFGVSTGAAQGTLAAFLAGLAIGQFFYGPASDRWGRRGPILVGTVLYIAATVACALSTSIEMLTIARFVQAIGGSAGAVVARAIVRDRFSHRDSARMLSMLMLISGLAPVLAPLLGSALLTIAGWRASFWLVASIGAVVLIATVLRLQESRSEETRLQALGEHPVRAYVTLLGHGPLVGFILAGALNSAAVFAYVSAAPGLLIGYYGIPASRFGWYFGANSVALIAMNQLNRTLLRRHTPEQIVSLARPGSLVFAAALALTAWTGFGGMWGVLVPLFFVIGSFGLVSANTMAGGLNVDPRRAGSISALMGGAQFGFGALASGFTGIMHDNGPRPLSLAVMICMAGSALALFGLALRKTPAPFA